MLKAEQSEPITEPLWNGAGQQKSWLDLRTASWITFAQTFLAGGSNYNFQPDEVETFYEQTA